MDFQETCLILGGAGYIGSFVVREFVACFSKVIVIDDLSNGHKSSIKSLPIIFIEGDICKRSVLSEVFIKYKPALVVHLCASAIVEESMQHPFKYYRNNVDGFLSLLECMREHECKKIIFSSSCTVFGTPHALPVNETEKYNPLNPYAESKQACEFLLKWLEKIYNIKYVIFRYFNVAGGSFDGTIGEDHKHESHLIPLVLQVPLGYRKKVSVFGNDYPTRDGTCIRDYIHVNDIAHAHLCAAKYLKNVNMSNHFNLGAGKGYSVLEVIKCCRMVTEHSIPAEIKPRRHGDAIEIYSSIHKASCVLGWIPQYSKIDNIIKSAWIFHYTHPNGYED